MYVYVCMCVCVFVFVCVLCLWLPRLAGVHGNEGGGGREQIISEVTATIEATP